MLPFRFLAILCLALIGCGDAGEPVRYTTTAPAPANRVSIPVKSVSLREVSLPTYASEEGIAVADASGAITTATDRLWADDPTRAVTLRLTNALADLTGRVVASDPWPFREEAEAVVEVRIETFVAETSGQFVAQGRYYVAHQSEEDEEAPVRKDRALSFRLVQPYDADGGFRAIAEARTRVLSALAHDIARRGLR